MFEIEYLIPQKKSPLDFFAVTIYLKSLKYNEHQPLFYFYSDSLMIIATHFAQEFLG